MSLLYSAADFRDRAERHLAAGAGDFLGYGDYRLNPGGDRGLAGIELKDAAVLICVVDDGGDARVILTKRTSQLRKHSGQIAFPGGKLEPGETAEAAALREAEEEIGLARHFVDLIGALPPIPVLSGFRITPVLATVRSGYLLHPNPDEVESVFEAPLSFLMDPGNHSQEKAMFRNQERHFYVMPYGEWRIWGITAGIIRSFYERFYE
jgi:8-oxo-dGTP pyrophosphatase MutT (NUDIX family)